LAVEIDTGAWKIPPIFELLRSLGNIPEADYRRTFNLGIGMILAVSAAKAGQARRILDAMKEPHCTIGRVIALPRGSRNRVIYT
jgi:phosphoribosylformylglycinamidine cyclo-ligase